MVVAAICLIVGIISISEGFYKKDTYRNSDTYYSGNVNAYVGGDAYNYIINAEYFAGYMALGGSLLVTSAICAVAGTALVIVNSNVESLSLPEIKEDDVNNILPPIR